MKYSGNFSVIFFVMAAIATNFLGCKTPNTDTPVISIDRQPQSINVTEGSITESLSVEASITQGKSLKYQWYSNATASNKNGSLIQGATNANFTIPNDLNTATASHYYYYVVVSANGAESKTSDAAVVTLQHSPGGSWALSVAPLSKEEKGVEIRICTVCGLTADSRPFEGFASASAVYAYLADSQPLAAPANGADADNFIYLPVVINLGNSMLNSAAEDTPWRTLLDALENADKFVALDLSASISPAEFNPGRDTANGKNKVVSMILPATASSIAGGTFSLPIFRYFTALTEISAENVITIGDSAFACTYGSTANTTDCNKVTSVSFPKAQTIGEGAFRGSQKLVNVYFPEVSNISLEAFYQCPALNSMVFPKAITIGNSAFLMSSLVSAEFPAATSIGNNVFMVCQQFKELILGYNGVVTLGNSSVFTMTHTNLVIKVPANQVENYKSAGGNWDTSLTDRIVAIGQ